MANKNKNKQNVAEEKKEVLPETVAAPESVVPEEEVESSDNAEPEQENQGEPVEGESLSEDESEPDTVLDDDQEMMEEQDVNPAPRSGKGIKAEKLKKFKIRHRAWNRRSPLRVVKPFDYDEQSFVVGTVFDWAKAGYKPASVQRLFARGLVRHVVEDGGVVYPFRAIQSPVKKPKKANLKTGGYDFLPQKDLPKTETEIQLTDKERLELNRAKHGIGVADDTPKNFSIKGSHKK